MIIAHCLVKNEENFIWYSISSILDFVDQIIIWDTGSTDKTVEIIKSIKNPKINFEEKGVADAKRISELRQEMLDKTKSEWVMILDGDEIWHKNALSEVEEIIKNKNVDVIIHPVWILLGDMYHYQNERAGRYKIGGRTGHYNLRFFKNLPGIKIINDYPYEAYVNQENVNLQNLPENKLVFAKNKYLHATHLERSTKDRKKIKHEMGSEFSREYYYPEAFFLERPKIVSNVWKNMRTDYKIRAYIETPLKNIKRLFK